MESESVSVKNMTSGQETSHPLEKDFSIIQNLLQSKAQNECCFLILQSMIKTDILIIGAGPVGLFTVFEAGLMKLNAIWSMPFRGRGAVDNLPQKPIYDIPGYPSVMAEGTGG